MRRWGLCAVAAGLLAVASAATIGQPSEHEPGTTLRSWLEQEHRFLHRYLAVVQQATHDYAYDYKTPALLMPVTIDLFTGYVAPLHRREEEILYPALQAYMTPAQQQQLELIVTDQQEEMSTVKSWQQQLEQYHAGRTSLPELADTIEYLGRMINRHIVLQEQRLFPFLDRPSPKEQAALLRRLAASERAELGDRGRMKYEQLLSVIEEQIKAIAGRIW